MKELTVIKIGGKIVDNPIELEQFLKEFSKIPDPKVLVHGGGALTTEISGKMGIDIKMHEGRRITDKQTLKLVTMLYAGLINKDIVANLQKLGCNAIGLSGADGNSIPAVKRSPVPVDFGYVGDVDPARINTGFLRVLLSRGMCPVFCALTHDGNGSLLNTNADTMASALAISLSREYVTKLIYCFEKNGVLSDPQDEDSVIPLLTNKSFLELKSDGRITAGMIPKLQNAFEAIKNGISEVHIKHAQNLKNQKGTILRSHDNG